MQSTEHSASLHRLGLGGWLLLACCALLPGCATRTVNLTGVCYDKNGKPRSDVTVKPADLSGRGFFFAPVLPKITEKARATTNDRGEFSVSFETRRHWVLDVDIGAGGIGSSARFSLSEEVATAENVAVKITIDQGALECVWEKR